MATDPLSDILRHLRLQARVFLHARFSGVWAVDTSGQHTATFHIVSGGQCWLHLPDRQALPLADGDVIVFPHDAHHTLANSAETPDRSVLNKIGGVGEGPPVTLVCGYIEFDSPAANPVLEALPELIHIPAGTAATRTLTGLLIDELETDRAGSDATVDRLSDALFIQVVRSYAEEQGDQARFLAALVDPAIRRALGAIHEDPGHPWSVQALAGEAALSRSAFARRFRDLVGMAPGQYVARWRMQRAAERLATGSEAIAAIAEDLGYDSEAAFRKAFRRIMGAGPGTLRRNRRTGNGEA